MEKNSVSKKNRQVIDSYDYLGILPLQMTVPDSFRPLRSQRQNFSPMKMSMHLPLLKSGRKRNKRIPDKEAILQGHCKMAFFSIRFSIIC